MRTSSRVLPRLVHGVVFICGDAVTVFVCLLALFVFIPRALASTDAVEAARQALAASEAAHGADAPRTREAIDVLVDALGAAGDGTKAETKALAQRALRIREALRPRDDASVAAGWTRVADVTVWSGDYAASVRLYRRAILLYQRSHRPPDADLGRTLDGMGNALRLSGKYAEAATTLEGALAVRRASLEARHVDIALTQEHLAAVQLQQGFIARARANLESALAIREQRQPDHPALAGTFNLFGDLLWFEGDVAKAQTWYERAVSLGERTLGPDHPELATYLRNLAGAIRTVGDPERAKPILDRAYAIATARLGLTFPEVGWILNDLAVSAYNQGDLVEARRDYERALAVFEQRFGKSHLRAATILHNLALLTERLDVQYAMRLERRALEIWSREQGPSHQNVGRASSALAGMYVRAGQYEQARLLYERALAIRMRRLGAMHPDVAVTLGDLAGVLRRLGRREAAWTRLSQALKIWEHVKASNELPFLEANETRGLLEAERGDLPAARVTLFETLHKREQIFGAANPDVARLRAVLASVLVDVGDASDALTEAITAEASGRAHLQLTMRDLSERLALGYAAERPKGLDLAASIVASKGAQASDPRDAARVFDEVIRSRGVVLDEMAARNRAEAAAVAASASLAPSIAAPSELASRRAALAAARQRLANLIVRGPESLTPEAYAAVIDQARTRKEDAERALAETSLEFRKELARSHVGLDDVRAALPAGAAIVSFIRYDQHLPPRAASVESVNPASQQVGAPRSRAANMPNASGAAQSSPGTRSVRAVRVVRTLAPTASASVRSAARSTPSYLAFVLRADSADVVVIPLGSARAIDARVMRWREEIGTGLLRDDRTLAGAERAYRAAGAALREAIWDPIAPHLTGAQRVLIVPDGALNLVSFASLPIDSTSFLVEQGPTMHYLTAERDVVRPETASRTGSGLLALGAPSFSAPPIKLAPASAPAPAVPTRSVSPVKPTVTQPAAAAADSTPNAVAPAGLRGAPASNCADFASMQFPPLPWSQREIDEVARAWSGLDDASASSAANAVEILSKRAASERAFKERAPGHQVLHLATHGFFVGGPCPATSSALPASASDSTPASAAASTSAAKAGSKKSARAQPSAIAGTRAVGGLSGRASTQSALPVIDNPLMLSGLAFAGVNRRAHVRADEDDGILTAEEVAGLDLDGVEWAVLSACDTGVGEIKTGEGVFGLRRAFQIAGVRTVIHSLWAVEDRSAMNWMRALYDGRRRDHLDTADAVRAASLAVLRDRRARRESTHPFFWAGFVATGDWR